MTRNTLIDINRSAFVLMSSVALCAASFIASATPAYAAQVTSQEIAGKIVTQVPVSIAGYDMSKPSHVAKLARVVRTAANRACGGTPAAGELRASLAFQSCKDKAIANVSAQVDSPVLSAQLKVKSVHTQVAVR